MTPNKTKFGSYQFVSCRLLSSSDLAVLSQVMGRRNCSPAEGLAGRGKVFPVELEGPERVVVKPYCRGGAVQHVVKQHHVLWGKRRCQAEYEALKRVKALGVNVPEPVAYAFQGRLFYKAWLITKEIEGPQRLSDIVLKEETYGFDLTRVVTGMVAQLIAYGIRHVDLHPGNVLVDRRGKVFLVDFDKTRSSSMGRRKLTRAYINRWSRAVKKHGLPQEVKRAFSLGLTEALQGV